MTVKKNPYPHSNFARTEDYLEELLLWNSGERGRLTIPENENGYEDISVSHSEAKALTVPEKAVSAEIHIEADDTASKPSRVVRYKHNGTTPTSNSGKSLGDSDVIEVFGKANLDAFKVIGIENGKSHFLRVQYYKTVQVE